LEICLKGLYNLYTYDILVPGPHIGSRKNPFTGKKGKKPSGELQRRIPLPGWTDAIDFMCTESLQSYNTLNEYDRVYE